jgi:S-adenosyl methyltransferase
VTDVSPDPMAGTGIDTTVPHSARIWNYWLGGKDNYPVDRAAGDAWIKLNPEITVVARTSRAFLKRTVSHLAGDEGVRQFLDVGTGLPTAENTHQVAQRVAPDARVVYVDHDPLVLAHARALLVGTPEGETRYLDADLRDPAGLLRSARETLDFDRPIALMFMQVLGHIADLEQARMLVRTMFEPLCPGSFLILNEGSNTVVGDSVKQAQEEYSDTGAVPYITRTPEEIESLFPTENAEWLEPGFVSVPFWRPESTSGVSEIGSGALEPVDAYGGVIRRV